MSYGSDKIRKLNAELDQFVYSCYHDLRAPVATILGLVNIIKSATPEEVDNYVNLIHESILKLDLRIKDIIDYSKNSRLRLKRQKIDVQGLIDTILDTYRKELTNQRIDIQIKIEHHTDFYTDEIRLTIILNNLISNAINFQREGTKEGKIDIKGDICMEKACFNISDNGIGITQIALDQACEMFYKASNASSGAGLGLYIVKESLKKLNGKMHIKSSTSDGTSVEVLIPNLL